MSASRTELSPKLVGLVGINPFFNYNSSSRLQMFCSHIGQSLVVEGATLKRCQSGLEREFAKYTFSVRMPCNALIHRVVQKYPRTIGADAIKSNPTTIVIYENLDDPRKEINILEIPSHHRIHQHYGFTYAKRPTLLNLTTGTVITRGTILADSPMVTETGDYMYGAETNVALMSLHQVIEDGVVISKSYAKRMTTKGYGSRVATWGKNRYPLNLEGYGTLERPKAFPDIGDKIRPDGLLFALREYDDLLAVVETTPYALRSPNYNFDKLIYAEPNARIVDVIIHKGTVTRPSTPIGLSEQPERYMDRTMNFYRQIIQVHHDIAKKRGKSLVLGPAFERLLVEALAIVNEDNKSRATLTFNRAPIDEWRVEIVYEYDMEPREGSKVTDCAGGKGVIVDIWDDERMPVDRWGNRAEVIMDEVSTIKRMNFGRLYEQAINAAGEYVRKHLPGLLGSRTPDDINRTWGYLYDFYATVSPVMKDIVDLSDIPKNPLPHIEEVIRDGVYLYMPTDTPVSYLDVVGILNHKYPDMIGPVTFTGASGRTVETLKNVMIGSMYFMLLEKTGNTSAGVASAKLQHYGIPAKLTNDDKYSSPSANRPQPGRFLGEDETRLIAAAAGGDVVADILDQTNNPVVHKAIIDKIIHAERPTNIDRVIDRRFYPMGSGRMQLYCKHVLECGGVRFVRKK